MVALRRQLLVIEGPLPTDMQNYVMRRRHQLSVHIVCVDEAPNLTRYLKFEQRCSICLAFGRKA